MSDPPRLDYQTNSSQDVVDHGHLKVLAICHYVWGALIAALSSIFIIHVVLGLMIAGGQLPMTPQNAPAATSQQPPPTWIGYFFAAMGGCAVLLGWTFGGLTIYSGRCIARRTRRLFSLVMAGINCASFPFGTVLGVFTFIVLLRPSVRQTYESGSHFSGA